ncbi:TetR/AcrR family transcriptional regulator [Alicyclobacillus fodiniaquatilis]|uniref:TetR/AcrR family transcriptional regulator n=1 Tax=Alicyclobacillus fodiniaquatilis TaxID=1661150 RepID=A0ABW4JBQ9_9BACL
MARTKAFDVDTALRQAMDLFWQQGYEKTSMQNLLDHMGIHRKSLYDTFGDKYALFMQAFDRYQEMRTGEIERRVNAQTSVKAAIRCRFDMLIYREELPSQGCFIINTAVELAVHDEQIAQKVKDHFKQTEQRFYRQILQGQQLGEFSAALDALQIAQYLTNASVGLRVMVKITDDVKKLERIVDTTLKVLEE